MLSYTISPLGDQALLVDFGGPVCEETNRAVISLFQKLKDPALPFVTNLVPAYTSLAICYDPYAIQRSHPGSAYGWMAEAVQARAKTGAEEPVRQGRHFRVPVCYDPVFGLDIMEVARFGNMGVDDVVRIHGSTRYRVFLIGFLPGFPYLGLVDQRIGMPRKESPRTEVAAGSVGIAGRQTGIYPLNSPGGWQIIGRTPVAFFRPESDPPVAVAPGDEITFFPITQDEFENYAGGPF